MNYRDLEARPTLEADVHTKEGRSDETHSHFRYMLRNRCVAISGGASKLSSPP